MKKATPQIDIDPKRCRGCGICVEFCKREVLTMESERAEVIRAERCTACRLCELYCPDLAITVTVGGL